MKMNEPVGHRRLNDRNQRSAMYEGVVIRNIVDM